MLLTGSWGLLVAEDSNQIQIEIVLDDGSIQKGFAKIQSEGEKASKGLGKAFSINGFADLAGAINLLSGAFNKFKGFVSDGINESVQAEKATLQLAAAMKSVPGVTDDAVRSFQSFTSELGKQIAVDDDVINSSAKVLASLGRLSGEGLKQATIAAADLSAGLGIDLDSAARRLALAAEGNTTAFQKLGFQFTKGASDAQILQEALGQIQTRFGGVAQSIASNTFEGVLNRIKVAFDDSNQALGDFITKSPVIREILKVVAESFEKSVDFLKELSAQKFLDNIIIKFVDFSKAVSDYLITPIEVFYNFAGVAFDGVVIAINAVIAGVGQLGGALAFVLEQFGVNNGITEALNTFKESTASTLQESTDNFQGFRGFLETPLSDGLGQSLDALSNRLVSVKDNMLDTVSAVKTGSQEIVEKLSQAAIQINQIYQQGIVKTISAAAQAIGASLVRGGAAFDDFKNVVLGIIGDIAIQIGTTLVSVGLGIDSLKLALGTLTGGVAIAAGLALIAVGGLLKSLSGGGISVSGGGGTGGGVSADTGGGIDLIGDGSTRSAEESRQLKPELVVNINGDVLGDEASGRKLIDLMNSAFDTSGVNLREGVV